MQGFFPFVHQISNPFGHDRPDALPAGAIKQLAWEGAKRAPAQANTNQPAPQTTAPDLYPHRLSAPVSMKLGPYGILQVP